MIRWETDMSGAVNRAKEGGKLVLADFFNPQ